MVAEQIDALSMLNVLRPDILPDPYPFYHRLRAADPVHWDAPMDWWVLTRHADVVAALRDPRLSAVRADQNVEWLPDSMRETLGPVVKAFAKQLLFIDPPDHTRIRSLVNKAFVPRVVEGMRGRIQSRVDELLDAVQEAGQMDVIADLAYPLPVVIIAEMLGVPPEDHEQFRYWVDGFGTILEAINPSPEELIGALQSVAELMDYLRGIVARHRASPRDDLLQALVDAREQGKALGEDELLINCILLLAAGYGTTIHLIGNGLLALLRDPAALAALRDDPSLIDVAVPELLRYDGTVQATGRITTADLEIGGTPIAAGQHVVAILGAANRDPAQFSAPDRLDFGRKDNRYVAFGYGIHFCVGAPLARLEGGIAINTVLRRLRGLHLATDALEWQPSLFFRGTASLPVAFEPCAVGAAG
jgi:cytochrome P450